jgi:hypothetical protein
MRKTTVGRAELRSALTRDSSDRIAATKEPAGFADCRSRRLLPSPSNAFGLAVPRGLVRASAVAQSYKAMAGRAAAKTE